jgi:hypothetical protein
VEKVGEARACRELRGRRVCREELASFNSAASRKVGTMGTGNQ